MRRIMCFAYGVTCYAIFFITFLYLIAFLASSGAPLSWQRAWPSSFSTGSGARYRRLSGSFIHLSGRRACGASFWQASESYYCQPSSSITSICSVFARSGLDFSARPAGIHLSG